MTALPLDVGEPRRSRPTARCSRSRWRSSPARTPTETKKRLDENAREQGPGKIYDSLFIRHWDTLGRRPALAPLRRCRSRGGDPVDVMKAMDADAPSKPFGGSEEFAFTPDGKVNRLRGARRGARGGLVDELRSLRRAGRRRAPRRATSRREPGVGHVPGVLARRQDAARTWRWRAPATRRTVSALMLRAWPDGNERVLTEGWDRSPGTSPGRPTARTIYRHGRRCRRNHALFAIDVATGTARTVVGAGARRRAAARGAGALVLPARLA